MNISEFYGVFFGNDPNSYIYCFKIKKSHKIFFTNPVPLSSISFQKAYPLSSTKVSETATRVLLLATLLQRLVYILFILDFSLRNNRYLSYWESTERSEDNKGRLAASGVFSDIRKKICRKMGRIGKSSLENKRKINRYVIFYLLFLENFNKVSLIVFPILRSL